MQRVFLESRTLKNAYKIMGCEQGAVTFRSCSWRRKPTAHGKGLQARVLKKIKRFRETSVLRI
jgi:hypothetical protein